MPRPSGGQTTGQGKPGQSHAYTKYPPNTRWRYFKTLPSAGGGGERKGGWVRVGSKMWNYVVQHNKSALAAQKGGQGRVGGGTASIGKVYHPSGRATQAWNPASPKGKATYKGGGANDNQLPGHRDFPGRHPGGRTDPGTVAKDDSTTGKHTKPAGDTKPPKTPKSPPNQLGTFSKAIGNPNSNKLEKLASAQAIAGLQYDAQIHDAKLQIAENQAQGAQNVADINTWYNHLGNLNQSAKDQNDAGVKAQTQGNLNDMLAGLAAIGGSANASAGAVAARSIGGNDLARQLGQNADNFYDNQKTALGQNQDAQKLAQQALNSQNDMNLHNTLQDLQGQRGQALTAAQQAILAFNNSARQANFGNRISKLQSIYGAQQLATNNVMSKAQLKQFQATTGSGANGHIPFYKQNADQRQKTIAYLLQGGKDAQGNDVAVPLNTAMKRAKLNGYDAAPGTVLWGILSTYTH